MTKFVVSARHAVTIGGGTYEPGTEVDDKELEKNQREGLIRQLKQMEDEGQLTKVEAEQKGA